MTHPLSTDFWYGWPAVIAVGYTVIAFAGNPDMALATRVWGSAGGGVLLVGLYWLLWRVVGGLIPSRRSKSIDE